MKITNIKRVVSCAVLAVASLNTYAIDYSNSYVFGDSLSDVGNLRAFSGNPNISERMTNGIVNAEIVAYNLGHTLTPSLHLIPGAPRGNSYATATAKARDEDGDEATLDFNLPTQLNAFLQFNGWSAPSDALYTFQFGSNDIWDAFNIRATGVLAATKEERKAAILAAKEMLKASADAEDAQIRKLIAAGAQHIVVVNAGDFGAIPLVDTVATEMLALATSKRQERRALRLPKVATKLTVKFNKLLAKRIAKIERDTGLDIIEVDLFSLFSNIIDNADDLGFSNIDTSCINALPVLQGENYTVNADCTDFPIAAGFLFWDEIHPTAPVHALTSVDTLEAILEHQ